MPEADYEKIAKELASPRIDPAAFVAPGAVVVGDVRIAPRASVWYGCVLRSDIEGAPVFVGEDANIQDGCVLHVDFGMPCRIGARVTLGHRAVVHGAHVGEGCLVGMGAVILSGATVGEGTIVAAGAVVPEGVEIPPGVIAAGVPAKIRRELTRRDRARLEESWKVYSRLTETHRRSAT